MIASGTLAVLAALGWAAPAGDAWQRRQWDWGQHDTGSGVARMAPVPLPAAPHWDERDGPVRWAEDGAARPGDAVR